jgi:hypothetical protein
VVLFGFPSFVSGGEFAADAGAALTILNPTLKDGTLLLGPGAIRVGAAAINGTVRTDGVHLGGVTLDGTILGNVFLDGGVLTIASTVSTRGGRSTINGNLTSSPGNLNGGLQFGSTSVGQCALSHLDVTGVASVANSLRIDFSQCNPRQAQAFEVLRSRQQVGSFDSVTSPWIASYTPTTTIATVRLGSLALDGQSGYATAPDYPGLDVVGDWTVEAWFKDEDPPRVQP